MAGAMPQLHAVPQEREPGQGQERGPAQAGFLPPLPKEHGAWVMLATALLAGLAGARMVRPIPAGLLGTAAFLAFWSQDMLRRAVRPGGHSKETWTGLALGTLAAAAGVALLRYCEVPALLLLAGAGGSIFTVELYFARRHGALGVRQPIYAQILATLGLSLAVPGMSLAAEGNLRPMGLLAGAACAAYFIGPVFYVRFLVECRHPERETFHRARGAAGLYHFSLVGIAASGALFFPLKLSAALFLIAYLPAVVRALHDLLSPPATPPPLKRVGLREALYSAWFALFLAGALGQTGH